MMRLIPIILVALLPSVILASVTLSSCPANVDNYVSIAREAMDDGNYITAFALYECALRRDPHSLEALAGRFVARAFMEECSAMQIQVSSH
jgi:cytochrome c-type biogenesis protein CcmH/NrfG